MARHYSVLTPSIGGYLLKAFNITNAFTWETQRLNSNTFGQINRESAARVTQFALKCVF